MEYIIYWLISETQSKTYIGFTDNIKIRIKQHCAGQVHTTKKFGKFKCYILERIICVNEEEARKREKYWKSYSGRKKLKIYFNKLINLPPSSSD